MHWGTAAADLALPAGVPVAVLIPSVADALDVRHPDYEAVRYQLSVPGASALDSSTTLAQNGIGDGAVLVLTRPGVRLPAPRYVDVAQEVSATLKGAARQARGDDGNRRVARLCGAAAAVVVSAVGGSALVRNIFGAGNSRDVTATVAALGSAAIVALGLAAIAHRVHRDPIAGSALSVIATVSAAVAGFVVVPGAPSVSNVLLAGAAAAATAVLGMRLSGCGVVALTAAACFAVVITAAALVGAISAAPVHVVASAAGVASLGLLGAAPRISIALTGLSPRLATSDVAECEPSESWVSVRAIRADRWLVSLRAGLSASAGVGAVVTVLAGAPRLACLVFGAVTAAVLLLRCRNGDGAGLPGFAVSGIGTAATSFGVAAVLMQTNGPTLVAATALVAATMYLGFAATAFSPVVLRCVEALEWLAWAALVPLACWIGGLYGVVRGMNLT